MVVGFAQGTCFIGYWKALVPTGSVSEIGFCFRCDGRSLHLENGGNLMNILGSWEDPNMVVGFAQGLWLTGCVGRHVAQCSLNRVVGAFPLVVSRRGYGLQMGLKSSDEDHAAALEEKKQRVLTNPMPVVKLKKGKSKIFYDGNAIVLEGAIDCILGSESKIGPAAVLPLVDHNFSVIGMWTFSLRAPAPVLFQVL
mmetsp:Transcript_25907/g.102148  ORF Transcript_25907/g.102148 Transcript_25907/m.102148 type:complete len:196 (+) Transcript_25907:1-588(+)